MFERIKSYFRNLFSNLWSKKVEDTKPLAQPFSVLSDRTTVLSLDTEAGWNAWRNSFVPTTRSFVPTWDQKLLRDQQIAAARDSGPAPDISGFELKSPNFNTLNTLVNGQAYTFYVGKPGTVTVAPAEGNQLLKVNGQNVIHAADIPNVPMGPVTIAVESVNGRVQVRVW
jgi:hypothetical protein